MASYSHFPGTLSHEGHLHCKHTFAGHLKYKFNWTSCFFSFLFRTGPPYVAQACLKRVVFLALASQRQITGVGYHTWPHLGFLSRH